MTGTKWALALAAVLTLAPGVASSQTFNPDGATHDPTQQSGWAIPTKSGSIADYNNCLRCHQPGGTGSDRTDYLFGGHRNMSRVADGTAWGMPGVDAAHPASPGLSGAALNADGSFAALGLQPGAPNATVDWIHGVSNAPSLAVAGYCAKDATGAVSSDDVPDLAACPACVSPDPASGAAGYPMDYPDALACAAAATHTGRPYTWFTAGSQPVYWIAGGAGLSGGPAMTEKGTRAYACGRCHTTGWTANHATDSVVTSQSKAPYLFFPGAGLAGQTPLGSPSALLDPGFGATAFATLAGGGVASVTVTAAGAAYPSAPPPAVSFSGGGGSGAAAHAVLAADPYGLFRVTAVVVDAPGNGYASAPSVSIAPPYALSSWDQWGVQCSRCHVAKGGAHAKNVWTDFPTGGDTIALCMGCHRQENATGPSSVEGGNGFGGNAGNVLPYTASQQQAGGLAPYGQGNQFLNSPHARFTGNFRDVGCPPYANDGYTGIDPGAPGKPALSSCSPGTMNLDGATSSRYASAFARASLFDLTGVSLSGAGSCTTCHDAHRPLNENTAGMSTGIVNRCTFCHTNPASAITPQVYPSLINHPSGSATPLGRPDADPSDSCIVCHMPPGMTHLLRISTDPSYTTFGEMSSGYPVGGPKAMKVSAGAYVNNAPGLVNLSHAAPDAKGYAPAVWVDLDHACRCHGGGVSAAPLTTTGSVTAGSTDGVTVNPVAVADVTGFWPGKRVTIAGAGWAGAPFSTIVAKVVPDASPATSGKVFLAYPAVTTVAGAAVTVEGNPAQQASFFTRAQLAGYAMGMHGSLAAVSFTALYGANGSTIVVDASSSSCDGSLANCDAFDWDWGDGSAHGAGATATHVYAPASPSQDYVITLTVTERGYVVGSASRKVTAYPVVVPPVASGSCTMDYTTWTISCTNTSTDVGGPGIASAFLNWGDGTAVSNITGLGSGPFPHTFLLAGTYSVVLTVYDRNGLQSTATVGTTVSGSFQYFSIAGKVFRKDGVTPISAAQIVVKRGTVQVATLTSSVNGSYATAAMKPATYTLTATKSGYTFASPTATVTTPPSTTATNLVATGP